MLLNIFIIVLTIYITCSVIVYGFNSYKFSVHSGLIRKVLYLIFLLCVSIGVVVGLLDYRDWQFLLISTVIIVFIDLSIYQTPNILKFGKTEFQHADKINDNVRKNELRIQHMNKKSTAFTTIIQKAEEDLASVASVLSKNDYEKELKSYLERYTKQFDLSLRFHFLPDDLPEDEVIKEKIDEGLNFMENLFNIAIKQRRKESINNSLFNAQVYPLEDGKYAIIPIYGTKYNFLLIVSADQEPIIEVDTSNIINMITLYDWMA